MNMTQRIRELAEQSTINIGDEFHPIDFFDKEKFAELIVRECLKIVEPTEDSGDEWCVTLKGTAQEIREHFGVEE
jgi:hypothetical protein